MHANHLLRIVAVIYTGGSVAHILRLIFRFTWAEAPFWPDWLIVILGSAGVVGLLRFRHSIAYRGRWERIVHWLIVVHLGASVLVHIWILAVGNHDAVAVFPYGYSYFALGYFLFFAWRSWTVRLKSDAGLAN